MATNWPSYTAGSAKIFLRPAINKQEFTAQTKAMVKPIKVQFDVFANPKLAAGFKATTKKSVAAATKGINAEIAITGKLAPGFKTDLRAKVKTVTDSIKPEIAFRPVLAAGFKTDLRTKVATASKGINATVGIKVNSTGVSTKIKNAAKTSAQAKIPVDVDLTAATQKLEQFRAAQAGVPVTLNVDVDSSAALAQLLALRSLASEINNTVNGASLRNVAGNASRALTGGIFSRPVRAIRLQIELDNASVARAEAELANIQGTLERARQQQAAATDRLTLAEQRHAEVMANSNASLSRRTAATQALTRAQASLADSTGRVNSLMGQEYDARNRVDEARDGRNGLLGLAGAGLSGFISALADAGSKVFTLRNLTSGAAAAMAALAAISLVALVGQLAQAAGVIALFPAGLSAAVAAFATIKMGVSGIGDAFKAAGKASESAADDAAAKSKAVASARKQEAAAARQITAAERGIRDAQKATTAAQKDLTRARKDARKEIDDLNRALGRVVMTEEAAAIAVARAKQNLAETYADPEADAIDRASAKNDLDQALADQEDLLRDNRDLATRAAEANRLGVDGSEQVVAAQDRVTEAMEAEGDAHAALADARTAYVEAQQAVTDAMNEGSTAADEYEKALGKLSPHARDFVERLVAMKPAFGDLRREIQDNMFEKLGESVQNLGNNWLPTLRTGLGGIATEINKGLRRAIADLDTDASRSKLATIFSNTKASIGPVLDGINDIIQGFLSLSAVGSEFLPGLSNGFGDLAERFRTWAESPEGKQQFRDFLRESLDTFRQILDIGKELGGVIAKIFRGSDETGESWLDGIERTLERWNAFLGTPEGQQAVKDFFADVKAVVDGIVDAIQLAGDLANNFNWLPHKDRNEDVKVGPDGDVLAPHGNDGGATGFGTDQSSEDFTLGGGTRRTDANGNPIDSDGNRLDHQNGWFPGVREGSLGDRILDPFSAAKNFLGGGAWDGIPRREGQSPFSAIMEGVGTGRSIWWQNEGKPAFDQMVSDMKSGAGDVAAWTEDKLTNGAGMSWTGLGNTIAKVTERATGVDFVQIKDGLSSLAQSALDSLTNGAGVTWEGFGNGVSNVVGLMVGPGVLGSLRSSFEELPGFFEGIVGGIGRFWADLPNKLQGPINSVIGFLNGLGNAWNAVAPKLGLPEWDPITPLGAAPSQPPSAGPEGPARTARWMGGEIKGGIPGKDSVHALLMPDEHVLTTREVRAAGGHDAIYAWRRNLLKGGGTQAKGDGPMRGYADGGIVQTSDPLDPIQLQLWDLVRSAVPGAVLTSGKRFADVGSGFDLHMQGKAIDLGGPMPDIARWIYNAYPQSAELIHWPLNGWQNLDEGRPHDFGPATNAQHTDHVHWGANDFLRDLSPEERKSLADRVKAGLSSLFSGGRSLLAENLLGRPLRALADQVPTFPELGLAGEMPKALARKLVDSVVGFAAGQASGGGSTGPFADWTPSAGAEQWRQMMIDAYRNQGYEPTKEKIDAWVRQIDTESGGNPNIAQQIVDVNGTGESAGVGLGQMIPGTWAAYRDPSLPDNRRDPWAMTNAMVRYGEQKYGPNLLNMIGKGHGYDQGGIFPHGTIGWNMSGLPEAVLTNPQWKMFKQFIDQISGQQQAQTLEQQAPAPGVLGSTPMVSAGTPVNPMFGVQAGVDTWESLGKKTQDRFTGALTSGFDSLVDSTLSPLGLPDPRSLIPSEVTDYAKTAMAWDQARRQTAAASNAGQLLADSGYYRAGESVTGAADQAARAAGVGSTDQAYYDYSTTINLQTSDTASEALRRAQQVADLRAIQHTGTARG